MVNSFGVINDHGINLGHIVYYKKEIVKKKDPLYLFNKKIYVQYLLQIYCMGDRQISLEFKDEDSLNLIFEKINRTVL